MERSLGGVGQKAFATFLPSNGIHDIHMGSRPKSLYNLLIVFDTFDD